MLNVYSNEANSLYKSIIETKNIDTLKSLISKFPTSTEHWINAYNAIVMSATLDDLKWLLTVSDKYKDNKYIVSYYLKYGRIDLLEWFSTNNFYINIDDIFVSAIEFTCITHDLCILRYLDHKGLLSKNTGLSYAKALQYKDKFTIQWLENNGYEYNMEAIEAAVACGDLSMVSRMLKVNSELLSSSLPGIAALHKRYKIMRKLMKLNCSFNYKPLKIAKKQGDKKMIKMLKDFGAPDKYK